MQSKDRQFHILNNVSPTKNISKIQRIYNLAYTYLARNIALDDENLKLKKELFEAELRIKRLEQGGNNE